MRVSLGVFRFRHLLAALLGWAFSLALLLGFATLSGSRSLETAFWCDFASAAGLLAAAPSDPAPALALLASRGGAAWAELPDGSRRSVGEYPEASFLGAPIAACSDLPGSVRLCAARPAPWPARLDPSLPSAIALSLPALLLALLGARAEALRGARLQTDRWLATRDPLTGLANRALLLDRLSQALERARREASPVTVAFVDLDGFKAVNDSLGHGAGDEALRQASGRLSEALRSCDTIARFGGDEFVLVFSGSLSEAAVQSKIDQAFAAPFPLAAGPARLGASCGVSRFPEDGSVPEDLIRRADAAMYRSKRERQSPSRPRRSPARA